MQTLNLCQYLHFCIVYFTLYYTIHFVKKDSLDRILFSSRVALEHCVFCNVSAFFPLELLLSDTSHWREAYAPVRVPGILGSVYTL